MASGAAQRDWDDPFRVYTRPRYPERELLVPEAQFDVLEDEVRRVFPDLKLATLESRAGMRRVALCGDPPTEVGGVIDAVREAFRAAERTPPSLSPVHTVTVGQPNVVGNPEDVLACSVPEGLPWRSGSEGEGVTVAIIDTGIEHHDWLGDAYEALPADFERQVMVRYRDRDVLGAQAGHCVFLAGLVLTYAPAARVMVLKTADSSGESDIDDVAVAMSRAARRGADVINLSLGCFTRHDDPPWALEHVLDSPNNPDALDPGIAVVAAAGNSSTSQKFWPGAFDRVTAVGALRNDGSWKLADYTNRGSWVDAYVPATNVLSTYIQYSGPAVYPEGDRLLDKWVDYRSGWATWSGTSMASAIWTGALVRAIALARASGGLGDTPAETARILLDRPGAVDFVRPLTLAPDDQDDDEGKPRRALEVRPAGAGSSSSDA
jgi:subtilisin family serine protease